MHVFCDFDFKFPKIPYWSAHIAKQIFVWYTLINLRQKLIFTMSHAFGSPSIFLYLYVYLYFHLILFINLIFNPQLNLFLSRGLEILMSDEMPGCCMATRLQPITECLTNHLNAVSLWLYPTCYQLFTIALWKLMIKVCVMH